MRRRRIILAAVAAIGLAAVVLALRSGGAPAGSDQARAFASAWSRQDFAQMYSDLNASSRARLAPSDLARAVREADDEATMLSATAGRAHATGGAVEVPITVRTRVFGTFRVRYRVPFSSRDGDTGVQWAPELAFPGLAAGERLSRRTTLPARAALLARDGTPIAEGPASATQRTAPSGAAASDIVGTLGPAPAARAEELRRQGYPASATVGLDGLERAFEARLAGTPGGELMAGSRVLASAAARPGHDVRTSISLRLQREAVSDLGGRLGAVVAMRPSTGELLALAGIPLSGLQPPGSTFKMITLTGVLEAHLATPSTTFPYETHATLDGVSLSNANGETCGGSLANAFAVSCNSVFAPLGARLGARRLVDVARRYGFDQSPGIPGAATSTMPAASSISDPLALGSAAIGQDAVQATPLQMITVAATIADGGLRPRPSLTYGGAPPALRVTSPAVADTVARLMVGVVRSGTGTQAAIPGVTVAGKTGTAELTNTTGNCSADQSSSSSGSSSSCPSSGDPANTDAWFAAFAPVRRPRVAVTVLLVRDGAGGDTAAPLARQVLLAGLHGF